MTRSVFVIFIAIILVRMELYAILYKTNIRFTFLVFLMKHNLERESYRLRLVLSLNF